MAASDEGYPGYKSNAELDLSIRELAEGLDDKRTLRSEAKRETKALKRRMRVHKGIVRP